MRTAESVIAALQLEPHIEGGYFKETYRNPWKVSDEGLNMDFEGKRELCSSIYFLLKSGQVSKFHQLKFDEIWYYHEGSSLVIHMITQNGELNSQKLGLNFTQGETPYVLVPANTVFGAEVLETDSFTLMSCVVSPGFDYKDFRLFKATELIERFPEHKEIITQLNGME